MASVLGRAAAVPGADLGTIVRRPAMLAVVAVVCGILISHLETAVSIVGIWIRSETFAHGFIVIPVVCWLIWRRRVELEATAARPYLPGVALVLLGGAAWLTATLSDVQAGRQFALLFMLEAAILAVVGVNVVRRIV